MTVHTVPEQCQRHLLLRELEEARHELTVDVNSIRAIENALGAESITVEAAYQLIGRTWPEPEMTSGYTFGGEIARQASDDAFRQSKLRSKRSRSR